MNNLATVEKIVSITPILNADSIELLRVQGYQSVAKKKIHKEGDLVCFIQPDSCVPRAEWNKFLWPKSDQDPNGKAIRLRAVTMRGALSQGLVIPLKELNLGIDVVENQDLTDILKIVHYEKPVTFIAGNPSGTFPHHLLSRTDEPRIQSNLKVLPEFIGLECYLTMKYDGSSFSAIYNNKKLEICSRSFSLHEDDSNVFWRVAKKYNIPEKLIEYNKNFAIQGECIGPKMNGNKLGLNELDLVIFTAKNLEEHRYLDYQELVDFCNKMNLKMVNQVGPTFIFDENSFEKIQDIANNLKYPNDSWSEGLVCRPIKEKWSDKLQDRLSVKFISENYLKTYKE